MTTIRTRTTNGAHSGRGPLACRLAGAALAGALFVGGPVLAVPLLSAPLAAAAPDSDFDGLTDDQETPSRLGTFPLDSDSDEDRLSDGKEVLEYHTNPLKRDTDGDIISDSDELFPPGSRKGSNPLKADTDDDGVGDWDELVADTDPNVPNAGPNPDQGRPNDRDSDGLFDADETDVYGTDPDVADTDGDGPDDGQEVFDGTDPKVPN